MGQAKQRGTFEERRCQSIERKAAEKAARLEEKERRWAAMTDEERAAAIKSRETAEKILLMTSRLAGGAGWLGLVR